MWKSGKLFVDMWKSDNMMIGKGESIMKIQNIIEDVLIASGITISLVDIQQVLSIILLVFNVCWILVKCSLKIYEHIKNKQHTEIANDIKETIDEMEDLKDKIDSGSDK